MNKLKTHLKNNFAIYAVLLTCLVVLLIAVFYTKEEQLEKVDTSMFKVVTLDETLKMFEEDTPKILVISTSTCSATIGYVPYLQIAQAKYGYNTYYLELDDLDAESKEFAQFIEKLDIEYNLNGNVQKFGYFIGSTPMTVIIKNKKMVFGYIGSMNTESLKAITSLYGVSTIEEN